MRGMIKVASDGRRVKPANDFVVSALRFYCGILSCDDDVVDKRCVENNSAEAFLFLSLVHCQLTEHQCTE